jgi:hypothetical protein
MSEKNSSSQSIVNIQTNKENCMSTRKSSLFYDAKLKDEIRKKVNELLQSIEGIYIEDCVCDRLCLAASEFEAGERQLIQVDVGPIRSGPGPVLLVQLEIDDFIVYDTEPDTPVLVNGIPKQSQSVKKPGGAT